MGVKDEIAIGALARALVRTGMYVDAGIDTSAGLDNPRTYAAAILNDPDLAADGLHFVMVETLARAVAASAPDEGRDHALHYDPSCEECVYLARPDRAALASAPDEGPLWLCPE